MKIFGQFFLRGMAGLLLLGTLVACETGNPGVTSGATSSAAGRATSNSEACTQACNNANIRCMDVSSTRRMANEGVTSVYGARSDCDRELRLCLPKCRGR
ncbi:MAG: hypothetical protein WBK91_07090 [Alphaproteobacteria bacterium]